MYTRVHQIHFFFQYHDLNYNKTVSSEFCKAKNLIIYFVLVVFGISSQAHAIKFIIPAITFENF